MEAKRFPIGVFDSGLGGLTVVRQVKKILPNESIIYFGDTARLPYGSKSEDTVKRYSLRIAKFLEGKGVKLIVVACNTSSSIALELLRREVRVPVVGVVEPACRKAVSVTKKGIIGVIGTRATMSSNAYRTMINAIDEKITVIQKACPLFVPLVEEGMTDGEIAEMVVGYYLEPLKGRIDTLILGCTHYPLLKHIIGRYVDGEVRIIDSSVEVAKEVYRLLNENNLLLDSKNSEMADLYYVTDFPQRFEDIARLFIGDDLKKVEKVNLE